MKFVVLFVFLFSCVSNPPEWAYKQDELKYAPTDYIVATGVGNSALDAERDAIDQISDVVSSETDGWKLFSNFGKDRVEKAKEKRLLHQIVLIGTRFDKVYYDKKANEYYTLGVLDRKSYSKKLKGNIDIYKRYLDKLKRKNRRLKYKKIEFQIEYIVDYMFYLGLINQYNKYAKNN